MYRLGELTPSQRTTYGSAMLALGFVAMVVAVVVVHWAQFPVEELVDGEFVPFEVDYLNWMPRGMWWKALGYLIAFGASQLMLVGAALLFVLGRKMSWAVAAIAATLAWMELVIIFGIVPSEFLNFSQTDLDWSSQRFVPGLDPVPSFLVLGNDISISWAVIKDSISMGYNLAMLVLGGLFAYKIQDVYSGRPESAATPDEITSPYGRTLVKGDR
ncbi:MAG TPA: hypothetical protein VIW46_14810 [Acidimicrobiia bacterium]|jgi:hypothetical protein